MSRLDVTDEYGRHISSTLAALSCLPIWAIRGGVRLLPDDRNRSLVRKRRVDVTTMRVLDAFASISVCSISDTFSTTYEVSSSRVLLYVASGSTTGVSVAVRAHLERVWDHLKVLAVHPDSPRVRDVHTVTQALRSLHSDLISFIYRFSWPNLRQRFDSVAQAAIRQLDSIAHDVAEFASDAALSECSPVLSEEEHARLADLRLALVTARTYILEHGLSAGNHWTIHDRLGDIRVLLEGPQATELMKHLDALTGTFLSRDFRSLVRLQESIDTLRTFAHSEAFARLCNLTLDIVPVAPVIARYTVDPDVELLSLLSKQLYTDHPLRKPEPNWESDLSAYLLGPLQKRYACATSEEVPAHPECALVAHLCTKLPLIPPRPSTQYVGTSEPCCLPCCRYIQCASALYFSGKLHIRESDGRIPPCWILCEIYRAGGLWLDRQPSYYTGEDLANDFRDVIAVLRARTARVRQAERVARGEPALTPEEQQYRDDVASPPIPYWMRADFET